VCSISEAGFKTYRGMMIPLTGTINGVRKPMKKKTKKQIPKTIDHDVKINYSYQTGEFFLIIPIDQDIPNYRDIKNPTILSCDSGIKTFQTIYNSNTGNCITLNNRTDLLNRLKAKIGEIQSKKLKVPYKRYKEINGIISDTHWQFVNWMTKKPDCSVILLPEFKSQEIKKPGARAYNNKLLNFNRHYQFEQRLKWKCLKLGIKLLKVDECYTSKTCGLCGAINQGLTLNDRVFNCINSGCQNKNIDRDYHAARNILIRTICV
jgi:transposase